MVSGWSKSKKGQFPLAYPPTQRYVGGRRNSDKSGELKARLDRGARSSFRLTLPLDLVAIENENPEMPTPIFSPFGKRQPRALVVGLRRVVKDPKATVAQRLRACELLAIIEGCVGARPQERTATKAETANEMKKAPPQPAMSEELRQLAEETAAWYKEKGYQARAESVPSPKIASGDDL